eukprot:scaffold116152_cov30-Prasinocladus_malaysianus.AAC.1
MSTGTSKLPSSSIALRVLVLLSSTNTVGLLPLPALLACVYEPNTCTSTSSRARGQSQWSSS